MWRRIIIYHILYYIIYIEYYILKSERPGGGTDLCGGGSLLHLWEDSAQQGEVKNGFVQYSSESLKIWDWLKMVIRSPN